MLDISSSMSHGDTRVCVNHNSRDLYEKSTQNQETLSSDTQTDTVSLISLSKNPKCIINVDEHLSSLQITQKINSFSHDKNNDSSDISNNIETKILSVKEKLTNEIINLDDKKIIVYENAKTRWENCNIEIEPNDCVNKIIFDDNNVVDKKDDMIFECSEWDINKPTSCNKEKIMMNNIDEGKIESGVRKDSAIYLEDNDEFSEIVKFKELMKENELSQRISSSIVTLKNCNIENIENIEIDDKMMLLNGNKKGESRYCRPRRESSGYMSNLSTFDDERKNSVTGDVFQGIQGLQFIKEKQRSSTKRLNTSRLMKDDESEMPDIEEVKESLRESSISLNNNSVSDDLNESSLKSNDTEIKIAIKTSDIFDEEIKKNEEIVKKLTEVTLICDKLQEKTLQSQDILENEKKNIQRIKKTSKIDDISSSLSSSPRTRQRKRVIHQYSSPSSSSLELERIPEKSCIVYSQDTNQNDKKKNQEMTIVIDHDDDDDDDDVFVCSSTPKTLNNISETSEKNDSSITKNNLPKSIKVYQLLSTQSEDRGDGEPRLLDRRISLQINNQDDDDNNNDKQLAISSLSLIENKMFLHSDSSPHLKIPSVIIENKNIETNKIKGLIPIRKLSSPGEVGIAQRLLNDNSSIGIRPIYPYCPYSPYGSPQNSPGTKRRPLRESRRVSIDNRHGALQLNQYKLLDNIGQGSFGIVKLAYNEEDETHYAMKILSKKKLMKKAGIFGRIAPGRKNTLNPLAKVYREIALLKKLNHPNVVKLVEVLDDPDEDNLYLVFELVQKGEVLQLPTDKPLDENTARTNFRDVVMGVEYLHYQRIVHRDIKPSNLLVDSDGHIKVADLGVSAELRASGELLSGSAGTPAFAAPETTIPGAQYSGTLCDIWSMGVTLYSLVTGMVPWDGSGSIIGVQAAVRSEPLRFPDKPIISDDLRDLITSMLAKDPAMRLNLQKIKTHRWLTNNGIEPLPSEADNCRLPVTVTDEEVARVVTRVPKLDTLILIKTMLKQHSFQNPFLPRRLVKPSSNETINASPTGDCNVTQCRDSVKSKTQQFHKAGRSNSAPDSYDWQTNGRQVSIDTQLTPVSEVEIEKR